MNSRLFQGDCPCARGWGVWTQVTPTSVDVETLMVAGGSDGGCRFRVPSLVPENCHRPSASPR